MVGFPLEAGRACRALAGGIRSAQGVTRGCRQIHHEAHRVGLNLVADATGQSLIREAPLGDVVDDLVLALNPQPDVGGDRIPAHSGRRLAGMRVYYYAMDQSGDTDSVHRRIEDVPDAATKQLRAPSQARV